MKLQLRVTRIFTLLLIVGVSTALRAHAQEITTPYPKMAPFDQYLMERTAEVLLARTAAPESVSHDARVLILGREGYETATEGKNGFVCLVWRSWAAGIDDPDFWNPKLRAPICLNPAAARFFVPLTVKKTKLVLAGRTRTEIFESISNAIDKTELPALEPGAMSYMLSKQGYLNDRDGHWRPHLMFFVAGAEPASWGAGLAGSPVVAAFDDAPERHTVFLIPVSKWSDGTPAPTDDH